MKLTYFEIHLVEHCNLKCQSCDNFSPLAQEEYIDINYFERQMKRMSEITDQIQTIRLLGGEPLLHPRLNELLKIARLYFPNTRILLTTNAILLNSMNEEFWNICHENNIVIEITYYPINIDREGYIKLAQMFGVEIIPFEGIQTEVKITHRNPINDKKDKNAEINYQRCYQRWRCISLKDGKIFPCTCIPNIYHFNRYFKKNLRVTTEDYIDIFKNGISEIEKFLDKTPPFCAYCNVSNRTNNKPWSTTRFDIEEWFDA